MLFAAANQDLTAQTLHNTLIREAIRTWSDSKIVGINLLGIRVGVNDLASLGTIGVALVVYYFLLCVRRENREIGQLLIDYSREMNRIGYLIYSSICAYLVFNLNKNDDSPITSARGTRAIGMIPFVRSASSSTVLLPTGAIVAIIISDVLSLVLVPNRFTGNWFVSPFRPLGAPMWSRLGPHDKVAVVFLELVAAAAGTAVISMTRKIREYQRATRLVLDDYRHMLDKNGVIPRSDSES
jgi:hypothetical protein